VSIDNEPCTDERGAPIQDDVEPSLMGFTNAEELAEYVLVATGSGLVVRLQAAANPPDDDHLWFVCTDDVRQVAEALFDKQHSAALGARGIPRAADLLSQTRGSRLT
jgi:hypothetical protein